MPQSIREKRANEKYAVGLDLNSELGAETIQSVDSTVDTGLAKEGAPTFSGTIVYQVISGGTAGSYYFVMFLVTTNAGSIIERPVIVRVISDIRPTVISAVNALVSLEDAKNFIGKVTDEDTGIIELLINSISTMFDRYTDRNLRYAEYATLYLDGNGEVNLSLPNFPVASIGTVVEDDITLTEGDDYDYLLYTHDNDAYLAKVSGVWTTSRKGVKLTAFKAGFKLKAMIDFDSGSEEPAVGATLVGASSAATGIITKISVTGGTWGGGTAAGSVEFSTVTGTFVDNENVNISGGTANVMTVNQPETPTLIPYDIQMACFKQVAFDFQKHKTKNWGETARSFPDGSTSHEETGELLKEVRQVLDHYKRFYR